MARPGFGWGIIILAIFCPPVAAVAGVVLAGAEMYSAASGKDWGTGRQLSDGERVLRGSFALFDLIPGVSYLTKVAKTGSTTAAKGIIKQSLKEGFEQGARNVDNGLKLVTKFGDNVLSKVDDFGQQADQLFTKFSAKGADYLSTGLKNMDDGVSQAARNFRHNMGMEPQLVSGVMPSGNFTVTNLASKLDDFSKAQHLKIASTGTSGNNFKIPKVPLQTLSRIDETSIVNYAKTMGEKYTQANIDQYSKIWQLLEGSKMNEHYLPVKESLGYKNLRIALRKVFSINLDEVQIQEGWEFENFGFDIEYKGIKLNMLISATGKNIQFEIGEGGRLTISLPNPKYQMIHFWKQFFS